MGMSKNQSTLLTPFLGILVCGGIILKEHIITPKSKKVWEFTGAHVICLFLIIIASSLNIEGNYSIVILILGLTVAYMGGIIVKQLYTQKEDKKCFTDAWLGKSYNYKNDSLYYYIGYISLYLLLLILLMITLLKRADDNFPMAILNDLRKLECEYVVIFFLPLILVMLNEGTALIPIFGVDGSDNKYISSETVFEKFMTGEYEFPNAWIKFILMAFFIILLFFFLFNYTGSASPWGEPLFFKEYSGNGNGILFVILITLAFFNVLLRGLFIQKCSTDKLKNQKSGNNSQSKNSGEFGCEVAKYGGILGLLFISYSASVIYKIKGMVYKGLSTIFLMVSILAITLISIFIDN